MMLYMTNSAPMPAAEVGVTPTWDLADRMRKALREAGLEQQEIAEYLGVHRGTVSRWLTGEGEPSTQTLRLWAIRCGVSYDWLTGASAVSA